MEERGWTANLSPSPFPSHSWDLVAHRACVLLPVLLLFGKTRPSPLEAGVEAHLPWFPLLELNSPETAVALASIRASIP